MSNRLDQLNSLSPADAEGEFLKCCGSTRWARSMIGVRPFDSIDDLLMKADSVWWSLTQEDWLEAFRAHPRIGEKKADATQSEQARNWSAQEQSGTRDAAAEVMSALAAGNLEYEQRFGFIYIVCATGRTPQEMLTILKRRLQNDSEAELRNAAEEQRKITQLRLGKLLQVSAA